MQEANTRKQSSGHFAAECKAAPEVSQCNISTKILSIFLNTDKEKHAFEMVQFIIFV